MTGGPPDRDAPDADLLAAHVAGDADAFGLLVRRHADRLWAVALRTTGDREEAADALQDALLAAARGAAAFRGDARVTTWLHRVVVNACLDRLRRRAVRPVPTPDETLHAASDGSRVPAGGGVPSGASLPADPADEAVATDRRERLEAALRELPVDQRLALVLVDVQGLGVAEAAEVLEVAEGTVKSRRARGRVRLAELLADLAPGAGDVEAPAAGNPAAPAAGNPAEPAGVPSADPTPAPGRGGPRRETGAGT